MTILKSFHKLFNKILTKREGFTLVEIIVGMGVFAIALLAIIQVFYYSVLLNVRSRQISSSANIARQEMNTIRLMSIEELDLLPANETKNIDVNNDGKEDYECEMETTRTQLPVGSSYFKYVVTIKVNPISRAAGTTVGHHKDAYLLRSVLIRNPNDQN